MKLIKTLDDIRFNEPISLEFPGAVFPLGTQIIVKEMQRLEVSPRAIGKAKKLLAEPFTDMTQEALVEIARKDKPELTNVAKQQLRQFFSLFITTNYKKLIVTFSERACWGKWRTKDDDTKGLGGGSCWDTKDNKYYHQSHYYRWFLSEGFIAMWIRAENNLMGRAMLRWNGEHWLLLGQYAWPLEMSVFNVLSGLPCECSYFKYTGHFGEGWNHLDFGYATTFDKNLPKERQQTIDTDTIPLETIETPPDVWAERLWNTDGYKDDYTRFTASCPEWANRAEHRLRAATSAARVKQAASEPQAAKTLDVSEAA